MPIFFMWGNRTRWKKKTSIIRKEYQDIKRLVKHLKYFYEIQWKLCPFFCVEKSEYDQRTIENVIQESMAGCTPFLLVLRKVSENKKLLRSPCSKKKIQTFQTSLLEAAVNRNFCESALKKFVPMVLK